MKDDSVLMEAYNETAERGKKEGFVPIFVCCGELETLLETLLQNVDYSFDIETIRAFREEMCKRDLPEGRAVLEEWGGEYEDYDALLKDDDNEDYDEYEEAVTSLSAYTSYDSVHSTTTVLLAEIPVTNSWEIFAWLPFGGWNECPGTEDLMAVSKYWYETYGAVPAAISHDVLEYMVPKPVKKEDAKVLAKEMMMFCSDIIEQGVGDLRILANMLMKSTIWYFWWD